MYFLQDLATTITVGRMAPLSSADPPLRLHNVQGDGACLFSAIAALYSIELYGIDRSNQMDLTNYLRRIVAAEVLI